MNQNRIWFPRMKKPKARHVIRAGNRGFLCYLIFKLPIEPKSGE